MHDFQHPAFILEADGGAGVDSQREEAHQHGSQIAATPVAAEDFSHLAVESTGDGTAFQQVQALLDILAVGGRDAPQLQADVENFKGIAVDQDFHFDVVVAVAQGPGQGNSAAFRQLYVIGDVAVELLHQVGGFGREFFVHGLPRCGWIFDLTDRI